MDPNWLEPVRYLQNAFGQLKNKSGELVAEDLRQAQIALSEITGEFTSDDLLGRWNYQNEDDLFKVFFWFASELIQNKLIEGTLNEAENLKLQTNTKNTEIIYDPKKIDDFIDKVYSLDLDELKRDKNKIKMGFQLPN